MARVVLENVCKSFGDHPVVRNACLDIPDKEFFILVGPSGCGKSTTLRMIAGLEEMSSGSISIDGRVVNDVPPKNRDIAMVFQNYALYPHMTVYENMAFGLKLRNLPKNEIDRRVREAADILNLGPLLERRPKALSGGQRQRVAVGRAIVRKPRAFLFDEPLSNLDAKLRVQMRVELKRLHERLQTTMIYVTHDQVEAMTMGDRICVMKDGDIHQVAPPLELYHHPVNMFVAGFIGNPPMNFIDVEVGPSAEGVELRHSHFSLGLPRDLSERLRDRLGGKVVLGLRPEDLVDRSSASGPEEGPTLKAVVDVVEPMGSEIYLYVKLGADDLVARMPGYAHFEAHQPVELSVNMDRLHVFDKESGRTIVSGRAPAASPAPAVASLPS